MINPIELQGAVEVLPSQLVDSMRSDLLAYRLHSAAVHNSVQVKRQVTVKRRPKIIPKTVK